MQLDLLRDPKTAVEKIAEAVAAAGPRLDFEPERSVVGAGPEFDLTRLDMAGEGRESEGSATHGDHPHRPIPGPGHADDVAVSKPQPPARALDPLEGRKLRRRDPVEVRHHPLDQLLGAEAGADDPGPIDPVEQWASPPLDQLQLRGVGVGGQLWGRVFLPGSAHLPSVHGSRAPYIAPRSKSDTDRPARRRRPPLALGLLRHILSVPAHPGPKRRRPSVTLFWCGCAASTSTPSRWPRSPSAWGSGYGRRRLARMNEGTPNAGRSSSDSGRRRSGCSATPCDAGSSRAAACSAGTMHWCLRRRPLLSIEEGITEVGPLAGSKK